MWIGTRLNTWLFAVVCVLPPVEATVEFSSIHHLDLLLADFSENEVLPFLLYLGICIGVIRRITSTSTSPGWGQPWGRAPTSTSSGWGQPWGRAPGWGQYWGRRANDVRNSNWLVGLGGLDGLDNGLDNGLANIWLGDSIAWEALLIWDIFTLLGGSGVARIVLHLVFVSFLIL